MNINRLLKDVTTMDEVKEKLEMWLTLSSYGDECIAAVLKDQPQNRRELAQAICRIEEVNPRGKAILSGLQTYIPHVGISTITHTTMTLPLSTGKSSPKKAGSRTKVSSRGNTTAALLPTETGSASPAGFSTATTASSWRR